MYNYTFKSEETDSTNERVWCNNASFGQFRGLSRNVPNHERADGEHKSAVYILRTTQRYQTSANQIRAPNFAGYQATRQ